MTRTGATFLAHRSATSKGRNNQSLEVLILQEKSTTVSEALGNSERKLSESWKQLRFVGRVLEQLGLAPPLPLS